MGPLTWLGSILLLGAMPFLAGYRPTSREHALEHPVRQRIVELVERRPMSSKGYLRDQLDVAWGVVQHHLHVLERAEILSVVRVGKRKRFFVAKNKPQEADGVALLRTPRIRELVEFIAGNPGAAQTQITQGVAMHRKVLRTYMDRLVAAGLVEESREGRNQVYHPRPCLGPALDLLGADHQESPSEDPDLGRRP